MKAVRRYILAAVFLGACLAPSVTVAGVTEDADLDQDGLLDHDEMSRYFTNPLKFDTDGDGFGDGVELAHGFSPRHDNNQKLMQVDSDQDYLNDAWELALGTGLMNPDSDGDLYLDGTEVVAGFDPLDPEPVQKEKRIAVDLATQRLAYYFGDVELDSFPISSGLSATPTPVGAFSVLRKIPEKAYIGPGYYLPNTKWNLHFTTRRLGYYIHGAYWHDNFGSPMSHGCVNVSYEDMEPLYWFAQEGTAIMIQ